MIANLNKIKVTKMKLISSSLILFSLTNAPVLSRSINDSESQELSNKVPRPVSKRADLLKHRPSENESPCIKRGDQELLIQPDKDRRTPISAPAPSNLPWKSVGKLEIDFPNGKTYVGTGTLIAPDLVLTAGHCLYQDSKGGLAKEIRFFSNGKEDSFVISKKILPADTWMNEETPNWDFGVFSLTEGIGEESDDYLEPSVANSSKFLDHRDSELLDHRIQVTGYPGEKQGMWTMTGDVYHMDNELIYYQIDTTPGQSGSPICTTWEDSEGSHPYSIIGIHINGIAGDPRFNGGVYFNAEKIKVLSKLMAEGLSE
ncbi:MAG: trypsin-like peptidase domain-containing protein [Alphaproteobacteria bacterium]|nr:trypsin-like peptidase domain-containing protein [Alphaproteobacteria bacterium]